MWWAIGAVGVLLVAAGILLHQTRQSGSGTHHTGSVDFSGSVKAEKKRTASVRDPDDIQTPGEALDYLCNKYDASHTVEKRADSKVIILDFHGPHNAGTRMSGVGKDVEAALSDLLDKLGEDDL